MTQETKKEQTIETTIGNGDLANVMLPCPFCGGDAEVVASWFNSFHPKKYHTFYPTCKGEINENCPAIVEEQDEQGGSCCDCKTVDEAVELWNKRDAPSAGAISGRSFGDTTWYAENVNVYNTDDDLDSIVVIYNRDTGSYMNLPKDVGEKIAEMLNNR